MHRARYRIPLALFTIWLLAASVAGGLREDVDRIIRETDLGKAVVAVSVIEGGSGDPVVDVRADERMIPASNMKLLTTGAALHILGPEFRFRTKLIHEGENLVIVGDGDPAFGDPELLKLMRREDGAEMDVEGFLDLWVKSVVDAGLDSVGEIVVDDRIFDREFVHPTWPRDQLNRRYCAQVSGLTFHLNVLRFYPQPRSGQRPSMNLFEPKVNWLDYRNRTTSRNGAHDNDDVWVARELETNNLTFYGNVKHSYRTPVPVTVHDMPDFFGRLLADRLRAVGVSVERSRLRELGEEDGSGKELGPVIHTPISTIIARCNRDSQNLYAESLLKRIGYATTGQPGSWLNGGSIIRHVVHERLDETRLSSKVVITDGSGMSRDNRVTPEVITAWLNSFANDERLGPMFMESLAEGGVSGTLTARRRPRLTTENLHGGVVQAKTGYINAVSCLSGYLTMPNGQRRCFSIMVNQLTAPVSRAKSVQDRIVQAIAKDMAREPVRLGGE